MGKSRVGVRVKEAVGAKKSHYHSEDLAKLTDKYNIFSKRLATLIGALKAYHANQVEVGKSRFQVAQELAALAHETPLFEHVGQMPGADRSSESVSSYLSIHGSVAEKSKLYASKYGQFVIDYAIEWHKVVTTRVDAGIKKAEELRVEVDHYQQKVEALRLSANKIMAKGKQVDTKAAEKLTRNEDKLVSVKQTHSKYTADLCLLIEEVAVRSWRDLHPLLVKVAQFDATLSGDESKVLSTLNGVVNELKRLAINHGIKPQARLKDLDQLEASLLSTKPPEERNLAIEAGGAFGTSSLLGSDQRLPPGTVSPQGMGGFPVQVSTSGTASSMSAFPIQSRDSSFNEGSIISAPTTLDMLAISSSAAPPPSMDSLAAAFGPTGGMTSPSPFGRGSSFDSQSIQTTGSAPPPAAPPPPPPPATPTAYGQAPPNPFGAAPAAYPTPTAPSPYGMPPPQQASPYGAAPPQPNPMGMYGVPSPQAYGAPPPQTYGAPPPQAYGAPPPQAYGAPPPLQQPGFSHPPPLPPNRGNPNPFGN